MKKYNTRFLALLLLLGAMLSWTSCKDDDNDSESSKKKISGESSVEDLSEFSESILSDLVTIWCDKDLSDLTTGWTNSTFEPEVGEVLDSEKPYVRGFVVGNVQKADEYAAEALATLGIDPQNPDGFTYSDPVVGEISYSHSSEDNCVAVINVNVKQIPHLQQIRLIKKWADNANKETFYKLGDIVRYKNRYYICTSDHNYGEPAHFVTFNDQASHSKGKCSWGGIGKDIVYNDKMAKASSLCDYIVNILCDDDMYQSVYNSASKLTSEEMMQVIPQNNDIRKDLISYLFNLDAYNPEIGQLNPFAPHYNYEIASWDNLEEKDDCYSVELLVPYGQMLADEMRWSMGGHFNYWVPYVFCVSASDYNQFYDIVNNIPSQSTLSTSHFKWKTIEKATFKSSLKADHAVRSGEDYYVTLVSTHWTHQEVQLLNSDLWYYFVLDWTKDYRNNMKVAYDEARTEPYCTYWTNTCITSSEITYTDKGKAKSGFVLISSSK